MTLNVPPDLEDRLRHEAERRGLTAEALILEFAGPTPSSFPRTSTTEGMTMGYFTFHVRANWDPEASVWVAQSEDVPGLSTEATTVEGLTEKIRIMVPEILMANQLLPDTEEFGVELTCVKVEKWPESFWRAFDGMPEDFERPSQSRTTSDIDETLD